MTKSQLLCGLTSISLLTCCAVPPQVPETLQERYREFIQRSDIPLDQRLYWYLGLSLEKSKGSMALGEAVTIQPTKPQSLLQVTIRFDKLVDGIYQGRMWTDFNPSIACISQMDLEKIGRYSVGAPILHHGRGPNNWFGVVRIEESPASFRFQLFDGRQLESAVTMKRGCLTTLAHDIYSRK